MIVTAIVARPRRPGRFDVVLDENESLTLTPEAIGDLGLAVGKPVEDVDVIRRAAAQAATYDRAVGMLARRGRAAADLRRQLLRKGEPADQIDHAIQRLRDAGILDDARYARQFTRSRATGGGLAQRRIAQELSRQGVDRASAAEAIAEVYAEERVDESAALDALAERKLRTMARLATEVQRRRLYAFLARRGYEADAIRRTVDRLTR